LAGEKGKAAEARAVDFELKGKDAALVRFRRIKAKGSLEVSRFVVTRFRHGWFPCKTRVLF